MASDFKDPFLDNDETMQEDDLLDFIVFNELMNGNKEEIDNKYAWRSECEDGWAYNVDPEDYETLGEYNAILRMVKRSWRSSVRNGSRYGLSPYDYETPIEYEHALDKAVNRWKYECEFGKVFGIHPRNYDSFDEYIEDVKSAMKKNKPPKAPITVNDDLEDKVDNDCKENNNDIKEKITPADEPYDTKPETAVEETEIDEDEINKTIQAIEDDIYGAAFDNEAKSITDDDNWEDDFDESTELVDNVVSDGTINDRKKNKQTVYNDYKQRFDTEKSIYRTELFSSLFAAAVVSLIPALFLVFGINFLKDEKNPDFFLVFFCALLPLGVIIAIFYYAFKGFAEKYDRYAEAKEAFYNNASKKEIAKHIFAGILRGIIVIALLILIIWGISSLVEDKSNKTIAAFL